MKLQDLLELLKDRCNSCSIECPEWLKRVWRDSCDLHDPTKAHMIIETADGRVIKGAFSYEELVSLIGDRDLESVRYHFLGLLTRDMSMPVRTLFKVHLKTRFYSRDLTVIDFFIKDVLEEEAKDGELSYEPATFDDLSERGFKGLV